MTTLLKFYNHYALIGRCDKHCHNATHRPCRCICGGANHGIGRHAAAANTTNNLARIVQTFTEQHPELGTIVPTTHARLHEYAHPIFFTDHPNNDDTTEQPKR